ncbi:SDR family NAD(P)-dependent oxidoreductase [Pseudonocardia xishanensis]|uniref:SDR family NAD(P)-dependent oxidoreductase n=1 Tax=Pseudonocardia xishanensis TaxID=630995 RepID=A0ABP8RJB5_9PSEU
MIDFGLRDRVILVTGAGSGIGRAVALHAATQGARIAVVDFSEADADGVVTEIKEAGGTAVALVADVRAEAEVEAAVSRCEEVLGPLDGVVACAGISRPAPAESLTLEGWSQVIDTNLTGAFLTARIAGSRLLARGGSLVVVSSVDGLGGHAGRVHYSASKFGVAGIVKSLAIEWGRRGVRVNAVAPGPVDTPLLRAIHSDEALAGGILVRTPLGRLALPADQANAILFLLSDAAAFVTGTLLPVDGGLTAGCFNDEPLS